MNKKILILIGFFCFYCFKSTLAQVGINTKNPQGIFHIDSKANTIGTANFSDDIIVDSQGNLGIGTLSPKTKLDIQGSLSITNSGENDRYILTSDNTGIGTWRSNPVSRINRISICKASGTIKSILVTSFTPLTSPLTFSKNELNLVATPDGGILIKAGLYLIIVDFDLVNANEYAQILLYRKNDSYFLSNIYRGYMTGQSVSFLAESNEKITPKLAVKSYTNEITYFDRLPLYNVNYNIEIKIIQLQ